MLSAEFVNGTLEVPHFPFPDNPKEILIEGHPAYEYVPEVALKKIIDDFSRTIRLNSFDALCVNLAGGKFMADEMLRRQNFSGDIIPIEYHENGQIVTPIPSLEGARVAVIDDVLDKFITGSLIRKDLPRATLLYLTKKPFTPTSQLTNCFWASEVDDRWLLGAGMNGELDGDGLPKDWGRSHTGIAVKKSS